MAQVQAYDCTSAKIMYPWQISSTCAHNCLPFFQAPECCVTNQLDGCLPCFKRPNVVDSNLFWSHFLNLLHATIHMTVQVHLQVMRPPHGSHDPLDQRPIEDFIYSCFPPLLFVSHISHWDPMLVSAPCWGDVTFWYEVEFRDYFHHISMTPLQVTLFRCGAITLAVNWHHQVADGTSGTNFLKAWSEVAQGQPISSLPDHR